MKSGRMAYRKWERIIERELWKLWERSHKFLLCHGPEHHIRVWKTAEAFGRKKGVDMDVLVACCLLHDVSSFNQSSPKNHEVKSARIAERLLRRIHFPKEKIPIVTEAIAGHRSAKATMSLEGKIFKAFDKIDAFGAIGVYRILLPLSIRRYSAEEITAWALAEGHLQKKWNSIAFPELRRQYRKEYEFTRQYFQQLQKKIGSQQVQSHFSEAHVFVR